MNTLGELDQHRYMTLSTFRRSGAEVATPVWFAAGDSGKVKRLRHSSRARVAPSDARGRVQGAWRDATARLVSEPAAIERAHAAPRVDRDQHLNADTLEASGPVE